VLDQSYRGSQSQGISPSGKSLRVSLGNVVRTLKVFSPSRKKESVVSIPEKAFTSGSKIAGLLRARNQLINHPSSPLRSPSMKNKRMSAKEKKRKEKKNQVIMKMLNLFGGEVEAQREEGSDGSQSDEIDEYEKNEIKIKQEDALGSRLIFLNFS
jgi:hypothetical protein